MVKKKYLEIWFLDIRIMQGNEISVLLIIVPGSNFCDAAYKIFRAWVQHLALLSCLSMCHGHVFGIVINRDKVERTFKWSKILQIVSFILSVSKECFVPSCLGAKWGLLFVELMVQNKDCWNQGPISKLK